MPLQLGSGGINPPAANSQLQHQQQLSQLPPIQYHPQLPQSFKSGQNILSQQSLPLTPPIQNSIASPSNPESILAPTSAPNGAAQHSSRFQSATNNQSVQGQTRRRSEKEKRLSRLAAVGSTCQAVIRWPIFEGAYDPDAILAPIFEDDSDESDEESDEEDVTGEDWSNFKGASLDVDEKELERYDLRHLIERFLTNVQTKNPILDQGILEEYVDEIERRGFDGSGKSCIVVSFITILVVRLIHTFFSSWSAHSVPSLRHTPNVFPIRPNLLPYIPTST